MAGHDIVVVGASAGGLDVVTKLMSGLPARFPSAVFVVIHITPSAKSVLASILNRSGSLPAVQAVDGQPIERGRVYVAVPNHHLLIKEGFVSVTVGPKENRHGPAIAPLFRTAARVYGSRLVGIILSGAGDDGVAGLHAIHHRGGVTIAQDPSDAAHADLPTIEDEDKGSVLPRSAARTVAASCGKSTTAISYGSVVESAIRIQLMHSPTNRTTRSRRVSGRRFARWKRTRRWPDSWPAACANAAGKPSPNDSPSAPTRRRRTPMLSVA
jgi:chemotaxis response regulator CheB